MQQAAHDSRSLAAMEWLLLSALIAAFLLRGFLPAWRTLNTDFPNYYLAAAIHRQGGSLDRAYEWRWFQRQKDHFQIDQPLVGFAPHPPMCALPLLPLAGLPPLEAKRVWLLLNLGFLLSSLWILARVTSLPWRRLLLLTFLCVLPLRQNFLFGQYYVLLLLLLCVAYYAADRGWRFTSGVILAAAASLKIFPAVFLILFLRKRNWRAAAGLVGGGLALAAVSLFVFGWSVHKVYLLEVLPRALRGDLVAPYVLDWNSLTALCHRFFLAEPELNPAPWLNSPTTYSIMQALMATVLLFGFLFRTGEEESPQATAWEWATFLPLLILLSSLPTAYHHCVLIFSVIVAVDLLLKSGRPLSALAAAFLFAVACFPLPAFAWLNLQGRLVGILLLYVLLLWKAPVRASPRLRGMGFALAAIFFVFLALSNLFALRGRSEDFSRRLPRVSAGSGTFFAARAGEPLLLDEITDRGFAAVILPSETRQPMPAAGDVLSIAASPESSFVYFELAGQRSQIFRLPVGKLGRSDAIPQYVGEGYDPAISADGRWLAYLHTENGVTTILLSKDGAPALAVLGSEKFAVLEMNVTADGNLIVATGSAADPHLALVETGTRFDSAGGWGRALADIPGAVRYPAISPDGKWLAFSRRESGAWHLFVRDLTRGSEQQLTSAACNATAPSWEGASTLFYVSDCGRSLFLGAPARVTMHC